MQIAEVAIMACPTRWSAGLLQAAERDDAVQKRFTYKQIEFWSGRQNPQLHRTSAIGDLTVVGAGLGHFGGSAALDPSCDLRMLGD